MVDWAEDGIPFIGIGRLISIDNKTIFNRLFYAYWGPLRLSNHIIHPVKNVAYIPVIIDIGQIINGNCLIKISFKLFKNTVGNS